MMVIGIDPGLTGAAVLVSRGDLILECCDLPSRPRPHSGKVAKWLDAGALAKILRDWRYSYGLEHNAVCVVIEQPRPMPGMPSTTSASLFDTVGVIRGVVAALNIGTILHADPKTWKSAYNLAAGDKNASIECAKRLFPYYAELFARAKDHNRAEAALLAHWGRAEVA